MVSLWPLFGVAFVAGLALVWLGWRGRRIDDHPLCQRCGYDLVGSDASTVICPECGTDLTPTHAVRIGHRRRLRLVIALGALVVLLTAGGGGAIGWGVAKGFDFNPYKPLWMLRREATTGAATNPQRAVAAEREILARLTNRKLSSGQIDSIVNQALTAQVDVNAVWHPWWGDFIEQAWLNKEVGDDLAMRYVRQAVDGAWSLEVPGRVREQGMLMVTLDQKTMRAGTIGTFMIEMNRGPITLDDGTVLEEGGGVSVSTVAIGNTGSSGSGSNVKLPVGKHKVTTEATVRVGLSSQWGSRGNIFSSVSSMSSMSSMHNGFSVSGRSSISRQFRRFSTSTSTGPPRPRPRAGGRATDDDANAADDDRTLAEWTLQLVAPLEVVPPDADLVELVRDDGLAERIRRSAIVERCRAISAGSMTMFDCAIEFDDLPVPVAFDVFARLPGDGDAEDEDKRREWPVMSVVADESGAKRVALDRMRLSDGRVGPLPGDATTVDLVLRANKRLAEQSGQARMWDGEIVLRDVPLEQAGRGRAKGGSRRPKPSDSGSGGPV